MKFEKNDVGWIGVYKPLKIFEVGQGSRPCGATLYQKVEIFDILGAAFPPSCGDWGEILQSQADPRALGPAKFDVNRCNESPLRGEKPDFWPVSKFKYRQFAASRHPAGKKTNTTFSHLQPCTIFPKLCMVI